MQDSARARALAQVPEQALVPVPVLAQAQALVPVPVQAQVQAPG